MAKRKIDPSRWARILYSIFGFVFLLGILVGIQRLFYYNYSVPSELVWKKVKEEAALYDLEPSFVYAVIFAESSLRPRAKNTGGNGIMQVSKRTWEDMSDYPYERVWEWKINIEVGTMYLDWCREYLENKKKFSYPLLAACYNKGPDAVRKSGFDIDEIGKSPNKIYQELFNGNLAPIQP